jgi:hypothetical protein
VLVPSHIKGLDSRQLSPQRNSVSPLSFAIFHPSPPSPTRALHRVMAKSKRARTSRAKTVRSKVKHRRRTGFKTNGTRIIKDDEKNIAMDDTMRKADRQASSKYWAEARMMEINPRPPSTFCVQIISSFLTVIIQSPRQRAWWMVIVSEDIRSFPGSLTTSPKVLDIGR